MSVRSDHAAGLRRNAQRLDELVDKETKRLRMRRFTYYLNRHARLDDPRLRLAGQLAGAPLYLVEAFVQRLDAFASGNTPRGSIEGFSIEATALHWGVREELLARLYAALEDPKIGWVDNDFVVDFWSENPDTEDATANERQDRSRKFRAALQELGRLARLGVFDQAERTRRELAVFALRDRARRHEVDWAGWKDELRTLLSTAPMSQRDSVTVTARSNQHLLGSGGAVDNRGARASGGAEGLSEGQAGPGSIDPQAAQAQVWLANEGRLLVIKSSNATPSRADLLIERWLRRVGGSHRDLAEILVGTAAQQLTGGRFELVVGETCDRRLLLIKDGPKLAMGPVAVAAGAAQPAAAEQTKSGDSPPAAAAALRKAVGQ